MGHAWLTIPGCAYLNCFYFIELLENTYMSSLKVMSQNYTSKKVKEGLML